MFDSNRKMTLDQKSLWGDQGQHPRRILHISNSTITWLDTKLTYAAVIARGSPFVKIIAFKHNENKIIHLYNLNICPSLANPDNLEMNPDQSYLELPCETVLSLDALFMTVTSFNGEVKLIKMPPVINPLKDEEQVPA